MRRAASLARRCAARRLRRPRRRALPLRPAVARGRQPGGGRGAGGVPPRLARLGVLRPRPRLAAHLAVRHPPQRGDRLRASAPAPARRWRPAATPTEGAADDELDRALTSWQVETALAELDDDHRRVLVEVHWRGRPYAEVAARPRHPGGHREEPRVLRPPRHAHARSSPRGGEMAERPLACEAWRPALAGWLVAQLPPDEEAALLAHLDACADLPGGGRQPPRTSPPSRWAPTPGASAAAEPPPADLGDRIVARRVRATSAPCGPARVVVSGARRPSSPRRW